MICDLKAHPEPHLNAMVIAQISKPFHIESSITVLQPHQQSSCAVLLTHLLIFLIIFFINVLSTCAHHQIYPSLTLLTKEQMKIGVIQIENVICLQALRTDFQI